MTKAVRTELMDCLESEIKKNTYSERCPLTQEFESSLKTLIVDYGHKPSTRNFVLLGLIDETLDHAPLKAQAVFNCVREDLAVALQVNTGKKRQEGLARLDGALTCLGQHIKNYTPDI